MKRLTVDNATLFSLAAERLGEGYETTLRIGGRSMLPFFRSGSVVRLRPVRTDDLRRGRVVLGRTERGTYVVHRIVRVEPAHVVLLGDGNWASTETIPREHIYGTVDCSRLHLALARVWLWLRPVRRYPLWILRRLFRE